MNLYDSLPDAAPAVFGEEAVGSSSYDVLTVDVPVGSWISSLEIARDKLGCTYFDWLSAVDEPGTGFRICAHVVSLENHRVRRLLLRTTVPHAVPSLPSAVAVYAGAEWHERETFEMFGVVFTDHPHLVHLLLPEDFEGHPLRKDFVLAARVAKAWPGAKEPGEAHDPDAPKRRQMLPPGVPDPNDWGPMKGQLPPAPARPARTPRAAGAAARTPREGAPARRTRSVADGSATQPTDASATEAPPRPARRTRSVADGSASQTAPEAPATPATPAAPEAPAAPEGEAPRPARRTRSAADGSASQAAPEAPATPTTPAAPEAPATPTTPAAPEAPATPTTP
ncbi:NADH-quinone oxidoreductase subunit C, partial [Streptomyces sp. NPDC006463]|uniref:NADH-quinone oxidoreductase subunit C n=1 Tax=Streptomyces sp. NPDC006463 TaxID=3364746 RepID=UPI0036A6674F